MIAKHACGMFLIVLLLTIVSISVLASADSAPPAIPVEYWGTVTMDGAPPADGLAVTAEVGGTNYAQASTTSGGNYNVILANGDRPLTYADDSTCTTHWGNGEACVPCNPGTPGDCVEGPQNAQIVKIKIASSEVIPGVDWLEGSSEKVDIISPIGDWDKTGCVDMGDFVGPFANNYGIPCSLLHPFPACRIFDLNLDGQIDMGDFVGPFANHYGEGC